MTQGPVTTQAAASAPPGTFAPLHHRLFAVIWAATVLGNIGTFMRDVSSSWLVTDLSASPAAVAMIQAAGTLPVFLFAIPAGVLSDILDRRRFLIMIQIGLGLVSSCLAVLAWTGNVTVEGLILLTFLGGTGAALATPAWQAITPELVPKADIKGAVALNSLGINIARSIGPALGGFILAALGAAAVYGLDVLTYVIVSAALLWWRPKVDAGNDLREHFGGALRAGIRYARASRSLHRVLWRTVLFFGFASAVWALLPLVARQEIGGGPGFYGLMLGSVGAGAICGALAMPRARARLGQDGLVLAATLITAGATILLALTDFEAVGLVATFVLGTAWITMLTTLNGTMQAILPNWIRGRGLAIYLTVFNGAMAAGSLGWGLVAQTMGTDATLIVAGTVLALSGILAHRAPLPKGESDLTPSLHWPEPALAEPVAHDRGPVMIMVTYRVAQDDRAGFLKALRRLSEERRRDGAYAWGLSEDAADPERMVEWFFVESWAEHLRQHRRVSKEDADLQAEAVRFHRGPEAPLVEHFLGINPGIGGKG
ncbi:MFS transporter [Microvirga lotononidis]|uniref:Arabinose efflux permease family protein n=1 Tax=Microvirga lotononidis TaxID=864069 RepID=I4YPV6_9HYPH|nr:MFS transporter [Microvirga lotononidis]EIM25998.1 arabinose efflux permease family protein [Microvirga lotononidis]WQO25906.1 MFS transporter [Microvirga lotononidis]